MPLKTYPGTTCPSGWTLHSENPIISVNSTTSYNKFTVSDSSTATCAIIEAENPSSSDTSGNGTTSGIKNTGWTTSTNSSYSSTPVQTEITVPKVKYEYKTIVSDSGTCDSSNAWSLKKGTTPRPIYEYRSFPGTTCDDGWTDASLTQSLSSSTTSSSTTSSTTYEIKTLSGTPVKTIHKPGNGRIEMYEACYAMRMLNSTGFISGVPEYEKGGSTLCDYTDINPNGHFGNLTKKSKISKDVGVFIADSTFYSSDSSNPNFGITFLIIFVNYFVQGTEQRVHTKPTKHLGMKQSFCD